MVWFSSAHLDVAGRVVFVDVGHLVLDLCVCVCVGWGGGGGGQNVFGKFSSMSGISYLTCLPSFSDLSSLSLSYTHTHTHTYTPLFALLQHGACPSYIPPTHTCLPFFNSLHTPHTPACLPSILTCRGTGPRFPWPCLSLRSPPAVCVRARVSESESVN